MGRDLVEVSPAARTLFDAASEFTGTDVLRTCVRGPMARLSRTDVLQPALTAVSLSCAQWLESCGVEPTAAAGHSVGELGALATAGAISPIAAVRAAAARGHAMHRAARENPGVMFAVGGLDAAVVEETLDGILAPDRGGIAAFNAPEQVVISGTERALVPARRALLARGARLIPLQVSGAWHCALMAAAQQDYARALDATDMAPTTRLVPANADGTSFGEPDAIREHLVAQLLRPVRWGDCVRTLIDQGVDVFVELGPGTVLRGLLRQIHPDPTAYRVFSAGDVRTLQRVVDELES